MKIDSPALSCMRSYLESLPYALVDFRLSLEAPTNSNGFPPFEALRRVISRLDPTANALFRLFRAGEAVSGEEIEALLPREFIEACVATEVLVRTEQAEWRTPNLLLVPMEAALVFVSTPTWYPTATRPRSVSFDLSSYVVSKCLPTQLHGLSVLDMCSGSGVLGLLCALRGAKSVVGLDINPESTELARLNAMLNGMSNSTSFRVSDGLTALAPDECFDVAICNTPYAPVVAHDGSITSLSALGNTVLFDVLKRLPAHLGPNARGILAAWRSVGLEGATEQQDRIIAALAESGFQTTTFVDRASEDVASILRMLKHDCEQRLGTHRASAVLEEAQQLFAVGKSQYDGFYNQIIHFGRGTSVRPQCSTITRLMPPRAA